MNPFASPSDTGEPANGTALWAFVWNGLICVLLLACGWTAIFVIQTHYREFVDSGDLEMGYWGDLRSGAGNDLSVIGIAVSFLIGLSTAPIDRHPKMTRVVAALACLAFAFHFRSLSFTASTVTRGGIAAALLSPMIIGGCGYLRACAG